MFDRARSIRLALVVSAALLLTVKCGKREEAQSTASPGPTVPPMKPAPATPLLAKKTELGEPARWDIEWDKVIELAIPPEMVSHQVPADVRRFCPRFYDMSEADKRAFWAYFFQALAGAEAGLKPETRVRHSDPEVAVTDKVTRRQVRSEGLLQLTYEDQERYGCDFNWQRDKEMKPDDPEKTILRPKNNLECGVKILNSQIIEHRKPLLSQSSYWSTLRPGTVSYHVFAKQMTNVPIVCGAQKSRKVTEK